jgi:hypothetical protein
VLQSWTFWSLDESPIDESLFHNQIRSIAHRRTADFIGRRGAARASSNSERSAAALFRLLGVASRRTTILV